MQITITISAHLPIVYKKEQEYTVVCCPILDVFSQGKNREEAKKNIAEALQLFFISCYEHGTLDEVMRKSGFIAFKGKLSQKRREVQDSIVINIPFVPKKSNLPAECLA